MMLTVESLPRLKQALMADAVVSGATGLLMILAAGFLADLLDIPEGLLRYAGWVLAPYVAFVVYSATRRPISLAGVWIVISANVLWAVASLLLLVSGWITPNALGTGFVLLQALVVSAFAAVQVAVLRKLR